MGSHVRTRQLPLVGIVAKEPCKRDHVRGKRHLILRSLLIVATPYHIIAFYDMKRKKEPLVGIVAKEPYKRDHVRPSYPLDDSLLCTSQEKKKHVFLFVEESSHDLERSLLQKSPIKETILGKRDM